jgi:AcrR family transcriptional regulator
MTTRDRIIETAIALFNEKGTKAVTTNHIAAAMGISPGNLYYHFRNKEEIIRAIFAQMDAVGMGDYEQIIARLPAGSLAAMEEAFLMIQRFNWRYRFFKRELTALILADPLLREGHIKVHRAMLQLIRHSIESSIAQGMLRPMQETERGLFVEEIWLLTLFWLNYLEVGGEEISEATLRRGNDLVRQAVRCRLTERGARLLTAAEASRDPAT